MGEGRYWASILDPILEKAGPTNWEKNQRIWKALCKASIAKHVHEDDVGFGEDGCGVASEMDAIQDVLTRLQRSDVIHMFRYEVRWPYLVVEWATHQQVAILGRFGEVKKCMSRRKEMDRVSFPIPGMLPAYMDFEPEQAGLLAEVHES